MQLSDRKLWKAWKNQGFSHPYHSKTTTAATKRDGNNHHHIDLENPAFQKKTAAVEKGGGIVYNLDVAGKEWHSKQGSTVHGPMDEILKDADVVLE